MIQSTLAHNEQLHKSTVELNVCDNLLSFLVIPYPGVDDSQRWDKEFLTQLIKQQQSWDKSVIFKTFIKQVDLRVWGISCQILTLMNSFHITEETGLKLKVNIFFITTFTVMQSFVNNAWKYNLVFIVSNESPFQVMLLCISSSPLQSWHVEMSAVTTRTKR